ncbi:FecR family protein [Ferruginibacter sp.]|uniref:FecR family protein n=1 Tax=Ferruginibacter sp. TaxID=1940288 RepID=UPI00198A2707|nr:FecR family protein [Ferruginibacter sp.]MBC7628143.1 FecR family protein [Ferruginibacter sp.]
MSESRLEYLFKCYINNKYSGPEEEELMVLLSNPENEEQVQILMDRFMENTRHEIQMSDQAAASILNNILKRGKRFVIQKKNSKTVYTFWLGLAASVLIILGGAYFISDKKEYAIAKEDSSSSVGLTTEKSAKILPGGHHAVLTTSDGKAIILDSMPNGLLTQQGNTDVKKLGGLLEYKAPASFIRDTVISYNTVSTPRGGQYQIVLSDGSKVWLNAASSIRFPTAFSGSLREVELTGEAYFEVAKNKEKPFQVKVRDMKIAVLGTHFNVKAYEDEAETKTSLLEGSVKIIQGKEVGLLKPGQQAVINFKDDKVKIATADMVEVIAWKNGLFRFEGANIETIMREIGRWYDVEIVYAGKVPMRRFEGKINRNAGLSEVLRILELSNVKFSIAGKKIIVQ